MKKFITYTLAIALITSVSLDSFAAKPGSPGSKENIVKSGRNKNDTTEKKAKKRNNATPGNIVAVAQGTSDLSTLAGLVKKAGLVNTLESEGHYTLFAPDNAAFERLKTEKPAIYTYITDANHKKDLEALLKNHILGKEKDKQTLITALEKEKKSSKAGKDSKKRLHLTTLNDKHRIGLRLEDGELYLNKNTKITKNNIKATNGVIHVIDNVIIPRWLKAKVEPTSKKTKKSAQKTRKAPKAKTSKA